MSTLLTVIITLLDGMRGVKELALVYGLAWAGLGIQVTSPDDTSNFGPVENDHPAGKARGKYVSTGIFKDF